MVETLADRRPLSEFRQTKIKEQAERLVPSTPYVTLTGKTYSFLTPADVQSMADEWHLAIESCMCMNKRRCDHAFPAPNFMRAQEILKMVRKDWNIRAALTYGRFLMDGGITRSTPVIADAYGIHLTAPIGLRAVKKKPKAVKDPVLINYRVLSPFSR